MFPLNSVFVYVLMWGSMMDLRVKGFEDRQFSEACKEAENLRGGYALYRVTRHTPSVVHAVICHTPRCAEPMNHVSLERVRCKKVPERKTETVEPEHYEAEVLPQ